MPTSAERAAAMRQAAEDLDRLAEVEEAARAAKAAYRSKPSDETRAAHREASQALSDAREAIRSSDVRVVPGDGVTITPGTVAGGSK